MPADDEMNGTDKIKPKLQEPAIVEHHMIVIRIKRRSENDKWFYTMARDGIQTFTSRDFDSKAEATPI